LDKKIGKYTVYNIVGQLIPTIIALFAVPIIIQKLGEDQFGIITLVAIIFGSSVLFDIGMGRTTSKFVANAIGEKKDFDIPIIFNNAVILQFFIGVLGAGIIVISAPILCSNIFNIPIQYIPEAITSIRLAGLSIPIVLITGSCRGVLEASQKFGILNLVKIIYSSLNYLAPLIGIYFGWGIYEIIIIFVILRLFQLLLLYRFCVYFYPTIGGVPRLNHKYFKKMFIFGGWVGVSNVLSPIQENIEKYLLAAFLPISAIIFYTIPKDILDKVNMISGGLSLALFPTIGINSMRKLNNISDLFIISLKLLTIILSILLFLLALFVELMLEFWIDINFSVKSTPVVYLMIFGVFATSINILIMSFFQGVGKPDITAKLQFFRMPVIIFVSWILIANYGLFGAAISWSVGRLFALLLNLIFIIKTLRISQYKSEIIKTLSFFTVPIIGLLFSKIVYIMSTWESMFFGGIFILIMIILFWNYFLEIKDMHQIKLYFK
jgi:O-antigen/teichoic acid export membrane protein